jgi:16S rRNA G966 N2-methylase RsmD
MDPPYKLSSLDELLETLAGSNLLEEGADVVVGHSKRLALKETYSGLSLVGSYQYGDSSVDFFKYGDF